MADEWDEGATEAPEATNREQQDEGQAQDVAADALAGQADEVGGVDSVRGGTTNPAQILPDDVPDLVETMNAMVASGRIDNGAYEGEPMHDDEESMRGDTEAGGEDPLEGLHEVGGAEALVAGEVEDEGDDPLGATASERGMADPDEDDESAEELDIEDLDEDELDELLEDVLDDEELEVVDRADGEDEPDAR